MNNDVKKQIIKAEIYSFLALSINIIIAFVSDTLATIAGMLTMFPAALVVLPYSDFVSAQVLFVLLGMVNYFIWLLPYIPAISILITNKKNFKYARLNIIVVCIIHLVFIIFYMKNFNRLLF